MALDRKGSLLMKFIEHNENEICQEMERLGLPKFRGKQIFDALINGLKLDEISVFSSDFKQKIEEFYPKTKIFKKFISKDGTKKYLIQFEDGAIVECVLMSYKYGNTLCLSTQVGCRMGCKFCASTLNGLERNLTAGEMLSEVYLINRDNGGSSKNRFVTNLVLMGSGEPLDNFDNVCKFLKMISSSESLNISERNISLSTCGLVDKIKELADKNFGISLTISLHATTDEARKSIMPIANRWSIAQILDACDYYFAKTGRRFYIEYTLVKGVNDSAIDAQRLANLLKGKVCHVNLIMLNPVAERKLCSTDRKEAEKFCKKLNALGISATIRRSMGQDIAGACGQLRNKFVRKV